MGLATGLQKGGLLHRPRTGRRLRAAGPDSPRGGEAVHADRVEEGKPFQGLPKAWERIVKRAGVGHITPHILRHSHASVANDLGYTEATVSAVQGRSTRSVTGAYIHHIDSALVAVADRVGAEIAAMMGDREEGKQRPGRAYRITLRRTGTGTARRLAG